MFADVDVDVDVDVDADADAGIAANAAIVGRRDNDVDHRCFSKKHYRWYYYYWYEKKITILVDEKKLFSLILKDAAAVRGDGYERSSY